MSAEQVSTPKAKTVRSILALAAGAATAPLAETAEAAIIVDSSLNGTVIGWNTGAGQTPSVTRSLPGGGDFTIQTQATTNGAVNGSGLAGVSVAWAGGGNGAFRRTGVAGTAMLATYGATVNAGTGAAATVDVNLGLMATQGGFPVTSYFGNPGFVGPPSKYLLFSFDNAGTTNYGWIELTSSTDAFLSGKSGFSATLGDWAYDNSGATITAGQVTPVPEPASASLAMGGALVAGAAGLRRWRKQRAAAADGPAA